jgi:hypothetical protein
LFEGTQAATEHRLPTGFRTGAQSTDRKIISSVYLPAIAAIFGSAAGMLATVLASLRKRLEPFVAPNNHNRSSQEVKLISEVCSLFPDGNVCISTLTHIRPPHRQAINMPVCRLAGVLGKADACNASG